MAIVTKVQATILTTAAVLSLSLGEKEFIPSKMYDCKPPVFESRYSWDVEDNDFFPGSRETLEKYEIIYGFASKIFEDSQDLDPAIVQFVSENFWKLI